MYWLCQDDDCNVWSLLKTHELSELKNGKKSLRDIIVGSEQIAIFRIDNNLEIREVIFEPMKEEWLPAADYDLGYFTTI